MYRLERQDFVEPKFVTLWSILAFQAGFVNAFGFLAFGKYVSHVTGFGTQIGVALASATPWFALELIGFPVSFILGSTVSGILTIARIERGERPRYDLVTAFLPLAFATVLILASFGLFGVFGEQLTRQRDFALLFLLSFVCGVQNGCFATMTKGQIRTTHLTGISTDIGTDCARILVGKIKGEERDLSIRTNWSRVFTFSFFTFGSITSVICGNSLGFSGLLVPIATSIVTYFIVRKIGEMLDARNVIITSPNYFETQPQNSRAS